MKNIVISTVLLLIVVGFGAGEAASAQSSRPLSATPKSFQLFYAKFRQAIVARDKTTVASMTRFPFKYGFDAGDEGTFSRTQFLKRYNDFLGGELGIFARRSPAFYASAGRFELVDETDASHYIFEKRGASYQFTSYLSEP
jgi:hypothetical protein